MVNRNNLRAVLCTALAYSFLAAGPAPARAAGDGAVLGSIPANCPLSPALRRFEPSVFGAGVGKNPVWAVGLRSPLTPGGPTTSHGWGYKVLWAVAPHTAGKILLRGWNLRTGAAIWFSLSGAPPTRGATIGPRREGAQAVMPNGQQVNMHSWRGFPSGIYIPSAGCYVLFAQWRTGSWIVPFAAGS